MKLADLPAAIWRYIQEEISLNRSDISGAARSRIWFLKRIENVIAERVGELKLYEPDSFVGYGSYFKRTKVRDVDEFEVLVVIDSNGGVFSRGGNRLGTGLGEAVPNPKYYDRFMKSDGSGVSPGKMLNWLKGVVEEVVEPFGGEAPERNRQVITATIISRDLKIDLAPAGIFKKDSDGTVFYNIPKGDQGGGWILTAPHLDMDRLDRVAEGRDGLRNVIRIIKRVKDTYHFTVSSFAIETAVVDYAETKWSNNLAIDLMRSMLYLSEQFKKGSMPDPFEPSENMFEGVESLQWYAERLTKAVGKLLNLWEDKSIDQEELYEAVRDVLENLT